MVERKQQESFVRAMAIKQAIEGLCMDITETCNKNPDEEVTVYVATTDRKAREYGWPDAIGMRQGIEEVLRILPPDISSRIVLEDV